MISLLNYPEVVKMMSDDLDWTQTLGDAVTNQQKDVLVAIQQLRDKAVAEGVIKTDDKIKVVEENDNVVIQSANAEKIYVPQYEPEMLYEPDYVPAPITYYPDPYPTYYYPTAPYFAGFVTGAIWGAAIDWDDWGVWGGRWDGNDIDIDCNNCFNNRDFNGKVNLNDVDWKNVDRRKINFDKNQFNKIDRNDIKNGIKANDRNNIKTKATEIRKDRARRRCPGKSAQGQGRPQEQARAGPEGQARQASRTPGRASTDLRRKRRQAAEPACAGKAAANVNRPVGKPKPAARVDNRPQETFGTRRRRQSGKREQIASNRGRQSMGGGQSRRRRPQGGQARRWRWRRWRTRRRPPALKRSERKTVMTTPIPDICTPFDARRGAAASRRLSRLASAQAQDDKPVGLCVGRAIRRCSTIRRRRSRPSRRRLRSDDFDELAKLLGLDAAKLKAGEGVMDTYAKIREGAAKQVVVRDVGDRKLLDIGDELWPLPFPIAKGDDGKWAFDTYAGIEEIINRRVGENEIAGDRDGARLCRCAEGLCRGGSRRRRRARICPEADQQRGADRRALLADRRGQRRKPGGRLPSTRRRSTRPRQGDGYFGYRFRILTGQGDNIAGGAYDYVINGNMIAGFALIAWPVKYGETGVKYLRRQPPGIVYEADLGPETGSHGRRDQAVQPGRQLGSDWRLEF